MVQEKIISRLKEHYYTLLKRNPIIWNKNLFYIAPIGIVVSLILGFLCTFLLPIDLYKINSFLPYQMILFFAEFLFFIVWLVFLSKHNAEKINAYKKEKGTIDMFLYLIIIFLIFLPSLTSSICYVKKLEKKVSTQKIIEDFTILSINKYFIQNAVVNKHTKEKERKDVSDYRNEISVFIDQYNNPDCNNPDRKNTEWKNMFIYLRDNLLEFDSVLWYQESKIKEINQYLIDDKHAKITKYFSKISDNQKKIKNNNKKLEDYEKALRVDSLSAINSLNELSFLGYQAKYLHDNFLKCFKELPKASEIDNFEKDIVEERGKANRSAQDILKKIESFETDYLSSRKYYLIIQEYTGVVIQTSRQAENEISKALDNIVKIYYTTYNANFKKVGEFHTSVQKFLNIHVFVLFLALFVFIARNITRKQYIYAFLIVTVFSLLPIIVNFWLNKFDSENNSAFNVYIIMINVFFIMNFGVVNLLNRHSFVNLINLSVIVLSLPIAFWYFLTTYLQIDMFSTSVIILLTSGLIIGSLKPVFLKLNSRPKEKKYF